MTQEWIANQKGWIQAEYLRATAPELNPVETPVGLLEAARVAGMPVPGTGWNWTTSPARLEAHSLASSDHRGFLGAKPTPVHCSTSHDPEY